MLTSTSIVWRNVPADRNALARPDALTASARVRRAERLALPLPLLLDERVA